MNYRPIFLSLCWVSISLMGCVATSPVKKTQLERSQNGMVVSTHPLATDVGLRMLKRGGNAVDAAVATAFALSVVEPFSAGIGGGGFLLFYEGKTHKIRALDFREQLPQNVGKNSYSYELNLPHSQVNRGYQKIAIPGTVAGLFTLHRHYGKLPWSEVISPGIALAKEGFLVDLNLVVALENRWKLIQKSPAALAIFSEKGELLKLGSRLIQLDLGQTLGKIGENPYSFYHGEIAQKIVADLAKNGSSINIKDLESYSPIWRNPLCTNFDQYHVCSMPPPSLTGVYLLGMLNILEQSHIQNLGNSAAKINLITEVLKIGYEDQTKSFRGENTEIPVKQLLSIRYAQERYQEIDPMVTKFPNSVKIFNFNPSYVNQESGETTHLNVVDSEKNAVSLTFTLNSYFGTGIVAEGTGIILNDAGDIPVFTTPINHVVKKEGYRGDKTSLGKMIYSSMSPTIVTKNNQLCLVMGATGGRTIMSTILQVLLNVLVEEMNVEKAVTFPRFHHQYTPDQLRLESGVFSPEIVKELRKGGHKVRESRPWGIANLIQVTPNGWLEGATDPRDPGGTGGF